MFYWICTFLGVLALRDTDNPLIYYINMYITSGQHSVAGSCQAPKQHNPCSCTAIDKPSKYFFCSESFFESIRIKPHLTVNSYAWIQLYFKFFLRTCAPLDSRDPQCKKPWFIPFRTKLGKQFRKSCFPKLKSLLCKQSSALLDMKPST
jgi:hypothetical protein